MKTQVYLVYIMDNVNYFDFLEKMLPSFSYGELDKELLKQFDFQDNGKYVTEQHIDGLAQGDIFNNVPIISSTLEKFSVKPVKAMLLSNTCDATRRNYLTFAPFIPISHLEKLNIDEILRKNQKNSLIYFPHVALSEFVVDLNNIFSLERSLFSTLYNDKKIKKEFSLKNPGYYLLLSKLIVLYCRMESEEIFRIS